MIPTDDAGSADLAHPQGAYRVLPYDPQAPPPDLPAGHGGIAVHAWCPPAAERHTLAPMIGVDGKPATYGWGHALIVVPTGERLVEVQYIEPQQSTMVSVEEGAIVSVEYAASYDAVTPGSLGGPGQRPRGTPMPLPAAIAAAMGVASLGCLAAQLPFILLDAHLVLALVLGPAVGVVAGALFFVRWRRRALRERR